MKFNEKQTPPPQPEGRSQTFSTTDQALQTSRGTQRQPLTEDDDEDPVLTEGYLPEIYFSLKSDNPADW